MPKRPLIHQRQRVVTICLAFAAVTATLATAIPGQALETGVCRIEVLVDGRPLAEYPARGTTYIEALRGREYALRLTNLVDRRIAVALAVDGLNSIDAKTTAASEASKWVLRPYETSIVSGWQVSRSDARRFFFTTEEDSYANWLGRDANVGVIEAVVYRERESRRIFSQRPGESSKAAPSPSGRHLPSGKAGVPSVETADADGLAATGIGRRIDHRVQRVHLDLESQPAARLRLRYEYREQLVHLGVLPSLEEEQALSRRERARGFSDFSFAPDPFKRKR
jgi:hypothetical protein